MSQQLCEVYGWLSQLKHTISVCQVLITVTYADSFGLQDLPTHVLHKITSSLEPTSQRSLFLSSSQLYRKWHIHVPHHDRHWQFVQQSIELLATMTQQGCCSQDSNVTIHSDAQESWGRIMCQQQEQSLQFELAHSTKAFPDRGSKADYTEKTQDQLWHRLTAVPKLSFATVTAKSAPGTPPLKLQTFAKHSFDCLCNARGFLSFYMNGLEDSFEGLEEGYHALKVLHAVHKGREYWQIDGEECIVTPPNFDFDNVPLEVTSIHAQFVSEGPPAQPYLSPDDPEAYFHPDGQVIHDFAYKGNVDVDAYYDEQHEVANDWYDHMEDLIGEEEVDDMDDLDDADMAQLLGAMQG